MEELSYAALLRKHAIPAMQVKPSKLHKRDHIRLDAQIDLAERIVISLKSEIGNQNTAALLVSWGKKHGSQPSRAIDDGEFRVVDDSDDGATDHSHSVKRVPYGFWQRFVRDELDQKYTDKKKTQLLRALQQYAIQKREGCQTRVSLRGYRKGSSFRGSGGANNATKASGLGFELLQYFVDVVQRLQCRTDSMMLMKQAREMREALAHDVSGRWSESSLPKLVGHAGVQWFRRWRKKYGISKQVIGMKLKVAWRKVKQRVLVLLQNIFRLRHWWTICHPGKTLRWLSLDQKPSWFNNAGQTGTYAKKGGRAPSVRENFRQTMDCIHDPYFCALWMAHDRSS